MSASVVTAEDITRASKSNLALAFVALAPERRHDMNVFYAFCRLVDDLADEPTSSIEDRRLGLQRWRNAITASVEDESPLAPAVRELIAKYDLNTEHFSEIIAGCEMDLNGTRYQTWDDLRLYCYRVASVVGLVSIEIFGYNDPRCRRYAVDLGLALQITNILRDVGEDYARDQRIYLPLQDLQESGYSEQDLAEKKWNNAFQNLMRRQAERAHEFYANAVAALPVSESKSMVAAEIMRGVYSRILDKMERDGFRVFDRRYRLGSVKKLAVIGQTLLRCLWLRRAA